MSTACVEGSRRRAGLAKRHLVDHARSYFNRYGWTCIAVRGKVPTQAYRRFLTNRPSWQQVSGTFGARGVTGVAVVCGAVSDGLRVRDYDNPDAYHAWADTHSDLARTLPTAKTRRGFHVYFRSDALPDTVAHYRDGELRGGKAYVLLPPSAHPDGGRYKWLIQPGDVIPEVPDPAAAGLVGPAPDRPATPTAVPPAVDDAITKTLPTGPGQRHNLVFKFARRLKGIGGLDTTYEPMRSYIREWHRRALPFIKSKNFAETETAFFDAWESAETPLSDNQFNEIVARALAAPDPEWFPRLLKPDGARKLLKVGMALQDANGGEKFFLAARKAAEIINADPTHASALLRGLAKAGYLQLLEKGSLATGEASIWAYTGKET
jgi:hypothetical protein